MSERQKTAIELELEELNLNLSRLNAVLNEIFLELKDIRNQQDLPNMN